MKILLIGILAAFTLGCQQQTSEATLATTQESISVACSKDLKVCEDGQSVGRDSNNDCKFFACPAPLKATTCQGDMQQCPDGSFVLRDQDQQCEFKACAENKEQSDPTLKPCTKDLKVCENGNQVGRNPANNCEFAACEALPKNTKEPMFCTQEVKQCPDGSYVGRDSNNGCAFRPCPEGAANLQ